jgi:ADP-heptose:LPS heptosyltransferase
MKIIISPWSQNLRNGKQNPKNYPYWNELIAIIKQNPEAYIIQIGRGDEQKLEGVDEYAFDLSLPQLKELLMSSDTFFSVDSFFPHMAHHYGKHGVVLFSKSDPRIFGYEENLNIFKGIQYLRPDQYQLWEACDYDKDAFVEPEKVLEAIIEANNL